MIYGDSRSCDNCTYCDKFSPTRWVCRRDTNCPSNVTPPSNVACHAWKEKQIDKEQMKQFKKTVYEVVREELFNTKMNNDLNMTIRIDFIEIMLKALEKEINEENSAGSSAES